MPYKTHYPKGRRAATPYLPDELSPGSGFFLVDGKELSRRMSRAYCRRERWQRQVARRRPGVPPPPTVAEQTLARLRYYADELAELLAPFRRTRPSGHAELRSLLQDAEARPTIITQVTGLRSAVARIRSDYRTHQAQVDAWRTEWDTASAERRQHILHVHRAQATQDALLGLVLLSEEALGDAACIARFQPDAFTATAGQWWYIAPLAYWPPAPESPESTPPTSTPS